ncbi:MAG: PKD domain-containing protein [Cyclobacteriaceae bacterium]|nr:PKD domain-containing protein [Cyclobacteriaceae bacterium]
MIQYYNMIRLALFVVYCLGSIGSRAQVLNADFIIPSQVCLNERIYPDNLSTDGTRFEWDFCPGELDKLPQSSEFLTTNGTPFGVEMVSQNGRYYGFYTTRGNQKLTRLDFGTDVNSVPLSFDLGNLGTQNFASSAMLSIVIVREGENFIGFIIDYFNRIYRIDFGTSITNTPTNVEIVYSEGHLNSPIDIAYVNDAGANVLLVTNSGNDKLVRLNFGASFHAEASQISVDVIALGYGVQGGISMIKSDYWCAVVSTISGNLIRVLFDQGIDSTPAIIPISDVTPQPYLGVAVAFDNNRYYVFAVTSTRMFRYDLGGALTNTTVSTTDFGGFNLFTNVWGFAMHKVKSDWLVLVSENSTNKIYKVSFPQVCFGDIFFSNEAEPLVIATHPGEYTISLSAIDNDGNTETLVKPISVSTNSSPDISLSSTNVCVNAPVNFYPISNSTEILNYQWFFGDGETSSTATPNHIYQSADHFNVKLSVASSNGCANTIKKNLKIYEQPVAAFIAPQALYCTNNLTEILNTTQDTFEGNLTYSWFVNDVLESDTRDLTHTFTSTGDQNIKLVVAIPGCSSEHTQLISDVMEGPQVSFTLTASCQNDDVLFVNTTQGEVSQYLWTFGDGSSTSDENPIHIYNNYGVYNATLTASNEVGCNNTFTKAIQIYSKPTANFSLALPPFSCSGAASQFTDLTPTPTDSNITSWNWTFGDNQNNTSSNKNPTHVYATAGDYSVSLNVATNFGCSSEITKTVTIAQTPNIDFTNTALCLNQPATFTPTATTEIKAWLWGMQNLTYTAQSPVHTFTTSGNQTVTMAATGNNNCVKLVTKNLSVPVPVTINFSANSTCAGKPAEFTETSLTGLDPAVSWSWDFAGQASATTSSATHIFPATGNFNVRLNSTRQSGCTYSSTRSIAISQAPVAQFTVSNESGGAPLAVGFVNTSSGATSWLWNFNDADQTTSTEFSPSFTYTQLGTYTAELIARNNLGCTDNFIKTIFVVNPEINVAVTNLLLVANNDGTVATVTFENRSNVVVVNPEIVLDLSGKAKIKERVFGTFLPGQQSSKSISTRIVSDNLSYICAEISVMGDVNSFDNRACNNLTGELEIVPPHPNPADHELTLEWIRGQQNDVAVRLINAQGQLVLDKRYTNLLPGLNQLILKVDALLPGLYVATVSDGDKTLSYKVLIHR